MRIIAVFHKTDGARYISHLDLQRAMQRALRRAHLPVRYTGGFNPHQVLSFATALSLGMTSCAEVMDVAMAEPIEESEFCARMKDQLPPSLALVEAHSVEDKYPSLTSVLAAADYRVFLKLNAPFSKDALTERFDRLFSEPLLAVKKTKAGPKEIDLRPMVLALQVESAKVSGETADVTLFLRCECTSAGALNPDLLLGRLLEGLNASGDYDVERIALWADQAGTIPLWGAKKGAEHEA